MIDLIYLILSLLSIININIKGINSYFDDYMNIENTSAIKGLFVWMIFFRHFTHYLKYDSKKNKKSILIDFSFKQNIVSLFLFYSGYGIFESFKKKGNNYIKTLPIKSLIFLIKTEIILFFFLCNNLLLGIKFNFRDYLQAIIFRRSIGNSYWFCFTIITIYIYSYFSFFFIKKNNFSILGIILITIICALHVYFVYNFYHPKSIISVDTIICFIFGFYYSFFKTIIEKIVTKNDIIYFGIISILILKYNRFNDYVPKNLYYISLTNGIFTIIIILISLKIRLKNEFLLLLNSHSYSIFLLQRIVMKYIKVKNTFKNNEFIKFFFEFITVIFMAILFDKYSLFIDKLFKTRNKQTKYQHTLITNKLIDINK